ncbi:SfnB family sulfur acquisition oxidoreductase [Frankia sp. AgB1.9]|uniref:SfnB family sulfur acquisition oxidoreductase n=1 Tax=unclassified Frankia TaxID=2632575 RepID=UPI001933A24A|nr:MULTISPECIES: SfnB family sulfur acquisition oxidoreductase [unclassified Frankia]MBL7488109.1 SfnB family sulfur acquisition oxidoreductase [Frankia sp. AgW1.1]MBL7553267.1 SfnB family sulfur acquisition oxidoreductase [Frankia sp. AgB1.9]MBL7624245.1 SfnB family sulfur acquisition oxidoreductase [Frankia sp. AgB1.8]
MTEEAAESRGADVISSDAEALAVARELAETFAVEASARDRERRLPLAEVDRMSAAGLFGVTVPARFGGPDVRVATLAEILRLLAVADPNIGQIPHSHFVYLQVLREQGTEAQQKFFFAEVLAGRRIANAQSERSSRTIVEDETTLTADGAAGFRLRGEKFYATGALFADWLAVRAVLPEAPLLANGLPPKAVAFVPRDADGMTLLDDWDGMGQRTTASGTVRLQNVSVPSEHVVPYSPIFENPTTYGAFAQVLHAALDAGIARAALTSAVVQIGRARPWFESGAERPVDDPLLVQEAGQAEVNVRAAEALVAVAADAIDRARADLTESSATEASLATAAARVTTARAAVTTASSLFELAGARSALETANLSRFWRDARTHTLHDPTRWKLQHVGRWLLRDTPLPRHGLL